MEVTSILDPVSRSTSEFARPNSTETGKLPVYLMGISKRKCSPSVNVPRSTGFRRSSKVFSICFRTSPTAGSSADLRPGKISGGFSKFRYQLSPRQSHKSVIVQVARPVPAPCERVSIFVRTAARLGSLVRSRPITFALRIGIGFPDRNRSFFSGRINSRACTRRPDSIAAQNFWTRSTSFSELRGN